MPACLLLLCFAHHVASCQDLATGLVGKGAVGGTADGGVVSVDRDEGNEADGAPQPSPLPSKRQ